MYFNGTGDAYIPIMEGAGGANGTLAPTIGIEGLTTNYDAEAQGGVGNSTSVRLRPNQPGQTGYVLTKGAWVQWEIETDTGTGSNGFTKWWMDGVLVGSYTGIPYPTGGITDAQWAPTWGGVGGPDTSVDQYQYLDKFYASGKAT